MAKFKGTKAAPPKPIDPWKNDGEDVTKSFKNVTSVLNAHNDEIEKLNGGLTLGQNTVGILKTLSFQMPALPPWKNAVYENAFVDFGGGYKGAQYLMEPGGKVSIQGVVKNGAVGDDIFRLPTGYGIDAGTASKAFAQHDSGGHAAISVNQNAVVLATGVDPCVFLCLEASWFAYAAAPPHLFTPAPWPLLVRHGFETKCTGLVVLGFRLQGQTGQNVGAGAPIVDWQDLGDGMLRINGVWGLQWGSRYDLRLYLTPEEEE